MRKLDNGDIEISIADILGPIAIIISIIALCI